MFYYIDWHRTQSFLIGLVKTESDFNIRSVQMVAVIIFDAYPSLASSDLTGHFEVAGIGVL